MEGLYKNKYRIKSTRLANYNYGQSGFYFVTICTKNRQHYFGKIVEQKIILNKAGKIIQKYWLEITQHFENVLINEFIIMPNHTHGIIEISNNNTTTLCRDEALPRLPSTQNKIERNTPNQNETYVGEHPQMSAISPKPGSLPVIIGSLKSICTKTINKSFPNTNFAWQPRFFDHIIRTEKILNKIQWYTRTNPKKWERDRNNSEGIWM